MVGELIAHKKCAQTAGSTIIKQHCNVSQADKIITF